MRSVLLIVVLAATAAADPRPTGEQALKANKASLDKALGKLKVKPITLAESLAADSQVTSDRAVVLVLDVFGRSDEPVFVVDTNKNVFRAIRAPRNLGRVSVRVCNAGPNRRIRYQFAIPTGHTYKGELKVAYDAYEIWSENTCR